MIRSTNRARILATSLSAVAGFVDAVGFLQLSGFFVSFMSGNSTRMAIAFVGDGHGASIAAALIALFVGGVIIGTLVARAAGPRRASVVLLVVAGLLAAGAACGAFDHTALAVACMTLAMGAENVALERHGQVTIGLTYITGTLGESRPAARRRGDRRQPLGLVLAIAAVARARRRCGARQHPLSGGGSGRAVVRGGRDRSTAIFARTLIPDVDRRTADRRAST